MSDLISRQDVIDEIKYELEMINSVLDSITLDFNARERLYQRRGEAREILNSIQQLPSIQSGSCSGCQHEPRYPLDEPCATCSNNYVNKWRSRNA